MRWTELPRTAKRTVRLRGTDRPSLAGVLSGAAARGQELTARDGPARERQSPHPASGRRAQGPDGAARRPGRRLRASVRRGRPRGPRTGGPPRSRRHGSLPRPAHARAATPARCVLRRRASSAPGGRAGRCRSRRRSSDRRSVPRWPSRADAGTQLRRRRSRRASSTAATSCSPRCRSTATSSSSFDGKRRKIVPTPTSARSAITASGASIPCSAKTSCAVSTMRVRLRWASARSGWVSTVIPRVRAPGRH